MSNDLNMIVGFLIGPWVIAASLMYLSRRWRKKPVLSLSLVAVAVMLVGLGITYYIGYTTFEVGI
jgi:biotin transporter BioY